MKKYLLCVALLVLSATSFRTAGARVCSGANPGDYTLNSSTGALILNSACTSVADGGFIGNTNIKSVSFPDSLTSIGKEAFYNCRSLTSVNLSNTSVDSIGDDSFNGIASPSTITVTKGSKAHEILGGLSSVTGDRITPMISIDAILEVVPPATPTPTPDPLDPTPLPSTPTPTPEPGTASGAADEIRVVPLPEDEFGSYELDPVTGEKNYLMFNTYTICMDFLNNEELCSGYERCYHK